MKNTGSYSIDRIIELDSLRGLAAISVLLYHYTSIYPRLIAHRDFYNVVQIDAGYFGVELFFMISGFVIFPSVARARSALDFTISRFARLFPAYWGAVMLTAIIKIIFYDNDSSKLLYQTLVNLTMLQTFVGIDNLDESYWTLSYELSFYALIIASFRLLIARGYRIEIALICWLAAVTIIRMLHLQIPYRITIIILLNYGQFFVFGVVFYIIYSRKAQKITYLVAVWAFLISTFGADPHTQAAGFNRYILFILPCTALMVYAVLLRPRFLRALPLQFLGRISYSLYLTHSTVGYAIMSKVLTVGGSNSLAVCVAATVSVAVGYILHITVEVPGQLLLSRRLSVRSKIYRSI